MQYSESHGWAISWPLTLIAAIAFIAGVAIWGAIALAGVGVVGDAIKGFDFDSSASTAVDCQPDPESLALEEQVRQEDECPTPTPEATATPEATPTPVTNRLDCGAIRGTDYLSREERTWFLNNCVNN